MILHQDMTTDMHWTGAWHADGWLTSSLTSFHHRHALSQYHRCSAQGSGVTPCHQTNEEENILWIFNIWLAQQNLFMTQQHSSWEKREVSYQHLMKVICPSSITMTSVHTLLCRASVTNHISQCHTATRLLASCIAPSYFLTLEQWLGPTLTTDTMGTNQSVATLEWAAIILTCHYSKYFCKFIAK